MIGRLNHVAIAVKDLAKAVDVYRNALGAKVSDRLALPEQGVVVAFVELENVKIELMEPLGADSPIAKFLDRNPDGGVHHLCYETPDMDAARARLGAEGVRIVGGAAPAIGAHGKPVIFLNPKDVCGAMVELEQA